MKNLIPSILFVSMITLVLASCASSMGTYNRAGSDPKDGPRGNPKSPCTYKG